MSRPDRQEEGVTELTPPARSRYVRWFDEIGLADLPDVGGKNASLGELRQALVPRGVRVPEGFAITASAYRDFLAAAGLERVIREMLDGLDPQDVEDLRRRGLAIRELILSAQLPDQIAQVILLAYHRLGVDVDVAVRSSATAEDLPDASFAGQQETYLNVRGPAALLEACRRCFASLFTDRAIAYRHDHGFTSDKLALSVGVQRMVRSDLAGSGVMFSIDTETGFRDAVLISAAWGLGESVVQGTVNPDEYLVFKPTLAQGFRPILRRRLGSKEWKLVYETGGSRGTKNLPVPEDERARFVLDDDEILELARWACEIEQHYSNARGAPTPMDMEWAKDGRTGELFIVQARPETVQSRRAAHVLETYHLRERGEVLVRGRAVGAKIGAGRVRRVADARAMAEFQVGEVLVADTTDPDWEPVLRKAAAIVTNRGGRTCHAAIVARELGVPAVVGAAGATEALADGRDVTVSCAEGEEGRVYAGRLPFEVERVDLSGLSRPRTKILMNVGNPEEAFALSLLPSDGVGLARLEFIILNAIPIHPMALVEYESLDDRALRAEIDRLTRGYADKTDFFVDRLAEGVAQIAAAFYPREVIVRLSDFKSNEYGHLVGGARYEPKEENPMLGLRGASRYLHPRYRAGFALECRALRRVREEMGLTNVKLMVPFCRTAAEGRAVSEELARHGLVRGENGLELYVMCEIPSNVIRAGDFAEIFDGFSIGSNDLTQLTLGVDRDSEELATLFDERDPAVRDLIALAIERAHAGGRRIGICGQAPSDHPEIATWLVGLGIDSLSLNPDAVLRTTIHVLEQEKARP
jgi:pyruvate, water dikinase